MSVSGLCAKALIDPFELPAAKNHGLHGLHNFGYF